VTRRLRGRAPDVHAEGIDRDADAEPSRSQRKRESKELTLLGEELLALPAERWRSLELPERLTEALIEARRLTSFGARRRQALFIGKLMRKLDDEMLARVRAAVTDR
jgi:ribosome-associated protein